MRRRRTPGRSRTRSVGLTAYRSGLDARPAVIRRNSSVRLFGSPLDNAICTGEPLYVKSASAGATPERAQYGGMLCRAVGGTRGRPLVQFYGLGPRQVRLELDKAHLRRALLESGADLEAVGAPLAAAYLDSIAIGVHQAA
jgi:hypothetical protein